MPITRLLVPLDGTPFAERALSTAARLARLAGGSLVLLRVEEPVVPPLVGLEGLVAPPVVPDAAVRAADAAYLERVAERLRGDGVDARTVVAEGDLASALRDACAREGVDLVVMASHARVGLARLVFGSAAAAITHGGPHGGPGVPVLVTHGRDEDLAGRDIARVLVVLDEETDAEATIDAAADLARVTGAALTLVMGHDPDRDRKATLLPTAVLAPPEDDADVVLPDDVPDERTRLARVAHALAAEGLPVETRVLEGGDTVDAVARHAEAVRADAVVVGAHGRGALADALRHAVPVPVLVVPA